MQYTELYFYEETYKNRGNLQLDHEEAFEKLNGNDVSACLARKQNHVVICIDLAAGASVSVPALDNNCCPAWHMT